jgi:hypothetical protein
MDDQHPKRRLRRLMAQLDDPPKEDEFSCGYMSGLRAALDILDSDDVEESNPEPEPVADRVYRDANDALQHRNIGLDNGLLTGILETLIKIRDLLDVPAREAEVPKAPLSPELAIELGLAKKEDVVSGKKIARQKFPALSAYLDGGIVMASQLREEITALYKSMWGDVVDG